MIFSKQNLFYEINSFILLLLGEVFCICQIDQGVNCVLKVFCILTDLTSCFPRPPSVIEKSVPESLTMNVDFSVFFFHFILSNSILYVSTCFGYMLH